MSAVTIAEPTWMESDVVFDLWFENSNGLVRTIDTFTKTQYKSDDEFFSAVFSKIKNFCDDHKFTIHYYRTWLEDDVRLMYDVGSHTEFFFLMPRKEDWRCESGFYQSGQQ